MKVIPLESASTTLPARRTMDNTNTRGLKRRHPLRTLPYQFWNFSNHGWRISLVLRKVADDSAGTKVRATTRLARSVNAMVSARSTNNCLVIPSVKIIGAYTLTVVRVDAMIAPVTWEAP